MEILAPMLIKQLVPLGMQGLRSLVKYGTQKWGSKKKDDQKPKPALKPDYWRHPVHADVDSKDKGLNDNGPSQTIVKIQKRDLQNPQKMKEWKQKIAFWQSKGQKVTVVYV